MHGQVLEMSKAVVLAGLLRPIILSTSASVTGSPYDVGLQDLSQPRRNALLYGVGD